MTKARARERAKAKAAQKGKKHEPNAEGSDQKFAPGRFNPESSTVKGPTTNASTKTFGGAMRGAGRSK